MKFIEVHTLHPPRYPFLINLDTVKAVKRHPKTVKKDGKLHTEYFAAFHYLDGGVEVTDFQYEYVKGHLAANIE